MDPISHYYAPLHLFEMETESLDLREGVIIRRSTDEEFKWVSKISRSFLGAHLTFVLTSDSRKQFDTIEPQFRSVIQALRLFKEGAVSISTIFSEAETQPGLSMIHLLTARFVAGGSHYELNSKEAVRFTDFYDSLLNTLKKPNKLGFLEIAIGRFASAIEEPFAEDRVIDFVIALEALYSTDPQELGYRLSLRISSLLGGDDNEKEDLFEFVKGVYGARSLLVHGKNYKPVKVKARQFTIEEMAVELERIARLSIRKFLNLSGHYDDLEGVLLALDKGIISETQRTGLLEMSKGEFD